MHPLLPASTVAEFTTRGALALQRHAHQPLCELRISFHDGTPDSVALLDWERVPLTLRAQFDSNRITEDGAEAVALTLVHSYYKWTVRRRLQRGESADWLLESPGARLVALEVSGIDGAYNSRRLNEKRRQASRAIVAPCRSACVVAFGPPVASLVTDE